MTRSVINTLRGQLEQEAQSLKLAEEDLIHVLVALSVM